MIKNKRGDIPITILVLGTFAICTLALVSFFASSAFVGESFTEIDLMEQMSSKINEHSFYQSQDFSDDQIRQILKEEDFYVEKDYFMINKTNEAFWFWQEDEFLFSVKFYRD